MIYAMRSDVYLGSIGTYAKPAFQMPIIIGMVYWVRDEYKPIKGHSAGVCPLCRISCAMQSEILSNSLYEKDILPNFRAVLSEFCFTIF